LRSVRRSRSTRARFGISYWDAAIIEAARIPGADVILSEDHNDGQVFDGVTVENPFKPESAWREPVPPGVGRR
jgi:predicted nucleic acid-binding protein